MLLMTRITLMLLIMLLTINVISGKEIEDKKNKEGEMHLIAVFKKGVPLKKATAILEKFPCEFQEGMDSSRGKQYFYKTGPKFILKFKNIKDKTYFIEEAKKIPEIYEVYEPDWNIQKD